MKIRRTEIAIETARVIVISKPRRVTGWCDACCQQLTWLTVDEAAQLAGVSSRAVFRMAEDGRLHSTETREGLLVVCPVSLIQASRGDAP